MSRLEIYVKFYMEDTTMGVVTGVLRDLGDRVKDTAGSTALGAWQQISKFVGGVAGEVAGRVTPYAEAIGKNVLHIDVDKFKEDSLKTCSSLYNTFRSWGDEKAAEKLEGKTNEEKAEIINKSKGFANFAKAMFGPIANGFMTHMSSAKDKESAFLNESLAKNAEAETMEATAKFDADDKKLDLDAIKGDAKYDIFADIRNFAGLKSKDAEQR